MIDEFGKNVTDFLWHRDVIITVAGIVFQLFIVAFYGRAKRELDSRSPLYRRRYVGFAVALWAVLNIVLFKNVWLFIISSAICGYLVWLELRQFWNIGLLGADRSIADGINYEKALKLCNSSLDFLGVGASKLTGEREAFELCLQRCDDLGRPIRFLLSNPANSSLRQFARQAGKPDTMYQDRVKRSLSLIAEQKASRSRNIEVRFYPGDSMPIFRLMFVDDWLCLASHYQFGKGDGSELPQLHIRKAVPPNAEATSVYYAFRTYFNRLWEDSSPWDFKRGLAG